jgi:hypothetical protein
MLLCIDIACILTDVDAQFPRCFEKAERDNLLAMAGQ